MVKELEGGLGSFSGADATILASGLEEIMLDAGTVFGLATVAYLLAPRSRPAEAELPDI
jgi:Na+(H+)/acetate symporter ActP